MSVKETLRIQIIFSLIGITPLTAASVEKGALENFAKFTEKHMC